MVPNNGESNGKEMENEMETGVIWGLYRGSSILFWGYYGTQDRVRFYPAFGV